ncbi:hypothetical protein ACI68E_002963 [Malassezia pachydermatis]|uniref:Uncharacterized protein n=1 Tax=Malassezia pachydermatis TaxID=77020 RepID=A0A0M8MKK1_9BASI|nr:hypothetical protein Malapachy_3814 [Malassezia pachydermatis]KOS14326.1 hypothetical protein Malapachy_3814 [Malassezia pachydermatis]
MPRRRARVMGGAPGPALGLRVLVSVLCLCWICVYAKQPSSAKDGHTLPGSLRDAELRDRLWQSQYQLRFGSLPWDMMDTSPPPSTTEASSVTLMPTPPPRGRLARMADGVVAFFLWPWLQLAHGLHQIFAASSTFLYHLFTPVRYLYYTTYTVLIRWPWKVWRSWAPFLLQIYGVLGVASLLGLFMGMVCLHSLRLEHYIYVSRAPRDARGALS